MKNVKKTILTLGMAGVLSILPRIGAKSDNVEGEVFIYDRSDSFGTTIGSLNIYSDCIRLLEGEQYSLIQYQNHLGFILNQDISKIHCMDHLEEFMGVHFIGVTKTKVNMRVDADTSTLIIESLDKGEEVSVLSILDNGWYLVSYHNTLGFIFSEYLNTFDYNEVLNEVRDMPTIQYHLKAKKDTKLFDSLGNSYRKKKKSAKQRATRQEDNDKSVSGEIKWSQKLSQRRKKFFYSLIFSDSECKIN